MEKSRLEAFSDGVFAIAITLLILEIVVPEVEEGGDLGQALLDLWPSYLAYATSFLTIGSITTRFFASSGRPTTASSSSISGS